MTKLTKEQIEQERDFTGIKFGRLIVKNRCEDYITKKGKSHKRYLCLCDCGSEKLILAQSLKSGRTISCGCYKKEMDSEVGKTHGCSGSKKEKRTPEYNSWAQMRSRCNNPNVPEYIHYGGRGIKVCDRWNSFENFLTDMGKRPFKQSLDRIDVNGDYTPLNCRWATQDQQASNTRRNVFISAFGRKMTLSAWSRETGINYNCIRSRLKRGWSNERALS